MSGTGTALADGYVPRISSEPIAPSRGADLRIGGHVSIRGKPVEVITAMHEAGFRCLQIHPSSPRQWRTPENHEGQRELIRETCLETGLDLYLHAIYLLNFASEDDAIYESSIRSLSWDMRAAAELGAIAVVFHVGSHRGRGFANSLSRVLPALDTVLGQSPAGPSLLLENSAGAGDCIGGRFSDLGDIIDGLGRPEQLGICLDTAHAFAIGHDLRTPTGMGQLVEDIDSTVGLGRLRLVHVNDSKAELGAGRDRHENIGSGLIGIAGFANLLAVPEVRRLDLVMETPNQERRVAEMAALRRACDSVALAAA